MGRPSADAQTQTSEWSGAREYVEGIPTGGGRSVLTPVATLSSLGEGGNYIDMSGVRALKDDRCGGVDREATRSVTEQQRILRYDGR